MFRFEFDERQMVNSIAVECNSFQRALEVVTAMLGKDFIDTYLVFIHKID